MDEIEALIDLWGRSDRVVALTGAGTSTDSGIPDFRGPNGLWTRNPGAAAMFDIGTYIEDEEVRRRAWEGRRSHPAWAARPNAGHVALTRLQRVGRLGPVLTQNIDGLHQSAGSVDVVELHGTIWEVECLDCGQRTPTQETLARPEPDPRCLACGGILKTATISFGQRLDPAVIDAAIDAARRADLLVAIGTTLTVMPAAGLADMARHLAIVNADPTPYDEQADVVVREPIGDILPGIADALTETLGVMTILHTTRGDFESLIDGPEDGPLVVLLHGFPELNVSWRHQIPALATAGYRVLAPNQRGYGGSVRDGSYATADLAEDVVAMIEAMGADTATVVGHDWGGGVAWTLAHVHPDRVERLVALNCPPPAVFSHALATNPAQLAKSWYMLFFQIPRLPEKFVVRHMPRALIGGSYNRKAWNHDNLAPYVEAFRTPEDARGPVNWYRGALRRPRALRHLRPVTAPVLIIWGVEDRFLGLDLIASQSLRRAIAYGNEPDIVLVEGAGHFVQNEAPEQVTAALLAWLGPAR